MVTVPRDRAREPLHDAVAVRLEEDARIRLTRAERAGHARALDDRRCVPEGEDGLRVPVLVLDELGGLTERASERKITLIPEAQKAANKGRGVSMDDAVGPGDIITVDESFF